MSDMYKKNNILTNWRAYNYNCLIIFGCMHTHTHTVYMYNVYPKLESSDLTLHFTFQMWSWVATYLKLLKIKNKKKLQTPVLMLRYIHQHHNCKGTNFPSPTIQAMTKIIYIFLQIMINKLHRIET